MSSLDEMSRYILSYDDAKSFFNAIVLNKIRDEHLLGISLAKMNNESIKTIKEYHHVRLMKMVDDLGYDEEET